MHQFQIKTIIIQIKMRLIMRNSQYMSPAVCHHALTHTYSCTHHVCSHVIMDVYIDLMEGLIIIVAYPHFPIGRSRTHACTHILSLMLIRSALLYLANCAHLTLVRLISHNRKQKRHPSSECNSCFRHKMYLPFAVISTN